MEPVPRTARLLGALLAILTVVSSTFACEPSRSAADAPLALVLSGGGAKGAWEAGVAAALIEQGVALRLVAGSSAGALTAAMLTDGRLDRLEALWSSLSREQVYAYRPGVFFAGLLPGWLTLLALDRAGALLDPAPLRELIASSLDLDRVRASPRRLLVITTDLVRRTPRVFDNATVTVEALMAAAAVPGAFPPVTVDGAVLVDGGLTGRAPVLEALASDASIGRVLVLQSYAADEIAEAPTRLRRTLEEAFETAMVHQVQRDTELARYKYPAVDVQLLAPGAPLRLRPLDFDASGMAAALALGREDARRCLERWQGR